MSQQEVVNALNRLQ